MTALDRAYYWYAHQRPASSAMKKNQPNAI